MRRTARRRHESHAGVHRAPRNAGEFARRWPSGWLKARHDGIFTDNRIAFVNSTINAVGIFVAGAQNISISDNYLAGGAGAHSTGVLIRSSVGEITIPSIDVMLSGNTYCAVGRWIRSSDHAMPVRGWLVSISESAVDSGSQRRTLNRQERIDLTR
jgi:hypothetical protein